MTPVEDVLPYIELVDTVLIMTVEPGFGGQKFMHDMMPKVPKKLSYILSGDALLGCFGVNSFRSWFYSEWA